MMGDLLTESALGAAVVLGFRHGFDWDHLAALTDLTGTQATPRRSMRLATLYMVGHALVVLALGCVAIVFAEQIPPTVDQLMDRVVGISLIALALWIICSAARARGAPPLRSRWMALIGLMRGVVERRRRNRAEVVVIEHAHPHDHNQPMHEHPHANDAALDPATGHEHVDVVVGHSHRHRHIAAMPSDPFTSYTSRSAFGVGMLHGVGAETPTQVVVFAAASNASGRPASIALLVGFLTGLVASNTLVAAASTLGFRRVLTHRTIALALAFLTATFSLVIGTLLLLGRGATLPPLSGG